MKKLTYLIVFIALLSGCKTNDPVVIIKKIIPKANFIITGDNKPAPCEVTFNNVSTDALSYKWEFGDGTMSEETNPKHTYSTGGTFTVRLTASSKDSIDVLTKNVIIQNSIPDPVSNFSFVENGNFAPSKFTFTNTSTNGSTYFWDFGDGQTSTLENPTHIFLTGGTYNVTLKSTNSVTKVNILNKTVVVKNAPTQLKINSIILTGYPPLNSNGAGWDPTNGPDVYFVMVDAATRKTVYLTTSSYDDILPGNLPFTFFTGLPVTINLLDTQFIITLYDYDYILFPTPEWMGGYYFTVRNSMPTNGNPYQSTISFWSASSDLKFTLNVEWLQ